MTRLSPRLLLLCLLPLPVLLGGCPRRAPPVSAEEWAEVERAARPAVTYGSDEKLSQAVDLIKRAPGNLCGTPKPNTPLPRFDRALLADEARQGLDALVAWSEQNGGPWADSCQTLDHDTVRVLCVGRVALAAAESIDAPLFQAALALGQRLRDGGHSLIEILIGATLLDEAVSVAQQRGWPPSKRFAEVPPVDLMRVIAAEGTCSVRLMELLRGKDQQQQTSYSEYEIGMVRRYQADLVQGARPRAADPTRLAAFLDEKAEVATKSASQGLQAIVAPLGGQLAKLREKEARLRAFLDGKRN